MKNYAKTIEFIFISWYNKKRDFKVKEKTMKVDGLGIVLAIILLPIILVVTYYVQLQVDTIATENSYNTKLLGATYDAMSAFEINTANEELSSVADSMRSIVLASNNIFLNTLATNLGISNASKESLQPYIPAVLYTMYDGYYIYAPTETLEVAEDVEVGDDGLITTKGYLSVGDKKVQSSGNGYKYKLDGSGKAEENGGTINSGDYFGDILYKKKYNKETEPDKYKYRKNREYEFTSNPADAQKNKDYILKSYVQYSAKYKRGDPDTTEKEVTINYTLDNYLNIVGKVKGVYYTKTGYLIKNDLVQDAQINGPYDLSTNNENDAKNKILGLKTNALETTIQAEDASVKVNGVEISSKFSQIKNLVESNFQDVVGTPIEILTVSEAETSLEKFYEKYEDVSSPYYHDDTLRTLIQNLEYEIQNCKAVAYYISSACFSSWVYTNLGDLTSRDIQDSAMTEFYKGSGVNYQSSSRVNDLYYDFSQNPEITIFDGEDPEDPESNFNTHKMEVIKNSIKYNLNLSMSAYNNIYTQYESSMPVLLDEEWDKILSNISIVSFMQGWECGLSIYNNYQIVSSTNNELTVTPSEIYYVKKDEFNNTTGSYHRIDCPYLEDGEYISFKSKEVKYDKVYDKASGQYKFDHKNLACYTCVNTNNYEGLFAPKGSSFYTNGKRYTSYYDRISSLKSSKTSSNFGDSSAKTIAGYIGIAKERQDIYKTNALPVSEGYKIIYDNSTNTITNNGNVSLSNVSLSEIKKLQITFSDTESGNLGGSGEPVLNLTVNINGTTYPISLNLDQTKEQTVVIDVSAITGNISGIAFSKTSPNYSVTYKIKSIKAIYK